MAKKKTKAVEPITEEVIIEAENAEDISINEVEKNPLETKYEPQNTADKVENTENNVDQFIFAQLRVINTMTNQAKAKRLADRVLRNRKG